MQCPPVRGRTTSPGCLVIQSVLPRRRLGAAAVLLAAGLSTAACGGTDANAAGTASASSSSAPAPSTSPPAPTTPAPAPVTPQTTAVPPTAAPTTQAAPGVVDFVMPAVVGMTLQDAQDLIQINGVFLSLSHDLLGTRNQVLDANWRVCTQNVPAGQRVPGNAEGTIDLGAVKLEEACP